MKKQTTDEREWNEVTDKEVIDYFKHRNVKNADRLLVKTARNNFRQGRLSALANFRVEIKQSVRNLNKIKGSNWETFVELNRLDAWCGSEIARLKSGEK